MYLKSKACYCKFVKKINVFTFCPFIREQYKFVTVPKKMKALVSGCIMHFSLSEFHLLDDSI